MGQLLKGDCCCCVGGSEWLTEDVNDGKINEHRSSPGQSEKASLKEFCFTEI
jgi:hypothetical protein